MLRIKAGDARPNTELLGTGKGTDGSDNPNPRSEGAAPDQSIVPIWKEYNLREHVVTYYYHQQLLIFLLILR